MNEEDNAKIAPPQPEKLTKKPKEIAQELGLHVETVYDYIRDGLFTNLEYFTVRRGERVRYVFFKDAAQSFLARNSGQSVPEEKPKRMYNRRAVKGKHQKGKKKA